MRKSGSAKKLNRFPNYALRLAAVLLLLVSASFWSLSGLLAKYTDSASTGHFARIASFSVAAEGNPDSLEIDLGDTARNAVYTISLENHSEVTVSYDLILSFEEPLPGGVSVTLKDGANPLISGDRKVLTFSSAGELAVLSTAERELIFTADDETLTAVGEAENYRIDRAFTVKVNFVQVD